MNAEQWRSEAGGAGKRLNRCVQGFGKMDEHGEGEVVFAAFDVADVVAVAVYVLGEFLLGQAESEPALADRCTQAAVFR